MAEEFLSSFGIMAPPFRNSGAASAATRLRAKKKHGGKPRSMREPVVAKYSECKTKLQDALAAASGTATTTSGHAAFVNAALDSDAAKEAKQYHKAATPIMRRLLKGLDEASLSDCIAKEVLSEGSQEVPRDLPDVS